MSPVLLRPQTDNDQAFLKQLFTETHTKKLQLHSLPSEIAETLLNQQFYAQSTSYKHDYPDAEFFIIERESQAIGKLVILESKATTHIIDIAISVSNQGQAIGSNLIKSIIEKSIKNQRSVTLSVDEITGPVALYKKLGFTVTGSTTGSISMRCDTRSFI